MNSWEFILANEWHAIEEYARPEIVTVSESQCPVDSRIADALTAFYQGCRDAGLPVLLSSGYRSYSEQACLFDVPCGTM